ncbi:MAG: ribonuclease III [Planctomycetota bacterium]
MDDRPPLNWLQDEAPPADADAKLLRCQQVVSYTFQNQNLLRSALTHASGASHRLASNERLEFLGDAVLGMIVCQWLYEDYPEYNEGELTKIKSAVVSRRSCGKVARRLGLDQCLIVGRGVTKNRSFPQSLVSDVFEAVIAAIYLEAGFDAVRDRLKGWLLPEVNLAVDTRGSGNHKSVLQQYAQRELGATPVYRLLQEVGPDHRKAFLMSAIIDTQTFAPAWGSNKKDAEQRAAANALASLHGNEPPFDHDDPIRKPGDGQDTPGEA